MHGYHCWSEHGESILEFNRLSTTYEINDSTYNNDSLNLDNNDDHSNEPTDNCNIEMLHDMETNMGDAEQEILHQLFEEAEKPLYTGSKHNKLDAMLKLFKLKSENGWSDKSFTSLLALLNKMLPEDTELLISTYQAKKLMCPMGLEVERIHACPNNCILYRNQYAHKHKCDECGASRYKRKKRDSDECDDDVTKNGPRAKMLWYFPITPRLKRLFSNEKEAKLLCWYSDERVIDGKLKHVADSPQWRTIDRKYPKFEKEKRHTGPRQSGNNIDVYLSPLIEDLKTLWDEGVNVYDAYKKEQFQLRAMIFCTINDFPAYGNLSGYSTKGKKASPVCEDETTSIWLRNCIHTGHRRFLPNGHIFRKKKDEFDGEFETRTMRTSFDAFLRVKNIKTVLGKRSGVEKGAL